MYYWYNLSCGNESIIRPFAGDIVTIYAMDKTIGAIQNKIQRQAKAWPDKYNPDDVYVVKTKKDKRFKLHGHYQLINDKLRRV
tara:strand:+ start:661 stop:909 length:249 start_codon:yes stop_codon:yes gene_type:complete